MEFDKELLSLEAQLPNLGPGERVDLCQILEDENPHVGHGKMKWYSLMILIEQVTPTTQWQIYRI